MFLPDAMTARKWTVAAGAIVTTMLAWALIYHFTRAPAPVVVKTPAPQDRSIRQVHLDTPDPGPSRSGPTPGQANPQDQTRSPVASPAGEPTFRPLKGGKRRTKVD